MWTNICDLTENSKIRRTRSGAGKENERRPQVSWSQFYKLGFLKLLAIDSIFSKPYEAHLAGGVKRKSPHQSLSFRKHTNGRTALPHSGLSPVLRYETEWRGLAVLLVKRIQVSASRAIVRINGDNPPWKCVPVVRGHGSTSQQCQRWSLFLWRLWPPLI